MEPWAQGAYDSPRRGRETAKAHVALQSYLDLGADRSLDKAFRVLHQKGSKRNAASPKTLLLFLPAQARPRRACAGWGWAKRRQPCQRMAPNAAPNLHRNRKTKKQTQMTPPNPKDKKMKKRTQSSHSLQSPRNCKNGRPPQPSNLFSKKLNPNTHSNLEPPPPPPTPRNAPAVFYHEYIEDYP